MTGRRKVAIVLMNLGGPDKPEAVQPFLFNLFNDPAIIRIPNPFRFLLAKLISKRRAPIAREIYAELGGGSPLVPLTEAQGRALEEVLADQAAAGKIEAKTFLAMRYWHPFSDEAAAQVKAWGADEIVLLPLYPHYSTTTTESSFKDWMRAAGEAGLKALVHVVCCYPTEPGFISSYAGLIRPALEEAGGPEKARVLFSAHGLPKKVIEDGDPYQAQVEQSCAAIVEELAIPGLDWQTCYQSRVGPLEWIGPATDKEIERAGAEGKALVVVPIAFVSEHSETLVELDIEYGKLARESGVPAYVRVAAVGTERGFIDGLARLVLESLNNTGVLCPEDAPGHVCTAERAIAGIS